METRGYAIGGLYAAAGGMEHLTDKYFERMRALPAAWGRGVGAAAMGASVFLGQGKPLSSGIQEISHLVDLQPQTEEGLVRRYTLGKDYLTSQPTGIIDVLGLPKQFEASEPGLTQRSLSELLGQLDASNTGLSKLLAPVSDGTPLRDNQGSVIETVDGAELVQDAFRVNRGGAPAEPSANADQNDVLPPGVSDGGIHGDNIGNRLRLSPDQPGLSASGAIVQGQSQLPTPDVSTDGNAVDTPLVASTLAVTESSDQLPATPPTFVVGVLTNRDVHTSKDVAEVVDRYPGSFVTSALSARRLDEMPGKGFLFFAHHSRMDGTELTSINDDKHAQFGSFPYGQGILEASQIGNMLEGNGVSPDYIALIVCDASAPANAIRDRVGVPVVVFDQGVRIGKTSGRLKLSAPQASPTFRVLYPDGGERAISVKVPSAGLTLADFDREVRAQLDPRQPSGSAPGDAANSSAGATESKESSP
jgi:hypothetical protein